MIFAHERRLAAFKIIPLQNRSKRPFFAFDLTHGCLGAGMTFEWP